MCENTLSCNVRESEKKGPFYLDPNRKLMGFILGQNHPGFVEISSIVFVESCWQTNQPTNRQADKQTWAGGTKAPVLQMHLCSYMFILPSLSVISMFADVFLKMRGKEFTGFKAFSKTRYLPPALAASFFFQHFILDADKSERWSTPTQSWSSCQHSTHKETVWLFHKSQPEAWSRSGTCRKKHKYH